MSDTSPGSPRSGTTGSGVQMADDLEDTAIRPRQEFASVGADGPPTLAQRIMSGSSAEAPPPARAQRSIADSRPVRPPDAPRHQGPSRGPQRAETMDVQPGVTTVTTGSVADGVPAPPDGAAASAQVVEHHAAHPDATHHDVAHRRHSSSTKPPVRRTRKARLRLSRIDPWSVMKTAFMFSIAAAIVLLVAVYVVWGVVEASGLFAAVDTAVQDTIGTQGDTTPFRLEDYINTPRVMGVAALIGVVDVVLITALATVTSFLYNLAATVLGGLEVTLAED